MGNNEASYVQVNNLVKIFDGSSTVIDNISLEMAKGDIGCVFGPNGCGKTTLLKILTGIDNDFKGEVIIGNKLPIQVRTGIVPQNYNMCLLPWRNAIDNIALPLEIDRSPRRELRSVVKEFLKKAGIELPLSVPVYKLSGGQKQLIVIARALINEPEFLVLDEPFASLDAANIFLVIDALKRLLKLTEITTVLVTHDLASAVLLSNQIFLFSPKPGRIIYQQKITLSEPRLLNDQKFIDTVNHLQQVYLRGGE